MSSHTLSEHFPNRRLCTGVRRFLRSFIAALLGLCVDLRAMATETGAIRSEIATHVARERAALGPGGAAAGPSTLENVVADFYARRNFAPAWIEHPDREAALRRNLVGLRFDGLTPEHYGLSVLDLQPAIASDDATAMAEQDWSITGGLLTALLHLYRGKLEPRTVDAIWNVERRSVDIQAALSAVTDAVEDGAIDELFAKARPQHAVYRALREGLEQLQAIADRGGWPTIPRGPTLDAGQNDPRVPVLRQRLALAGYETGPADPSDETFDPALLAALRQFQEEQYLEADGRVGPRTRAALDVPVQARIDQVRANLERARWLLHDLPEDYVLVDIAGFRVRYMRAGMPIFTSRIQVGQPDRRTPIFRAEITSLTLNPQWVVPPTILANDIVPALRRDRKYLEKHHLRAVNGQGVEIDGDRIDWLHDKDVFLRQEAGPDGALGRIAIRFPNRFAVYLHETPHALLFSPAQRAFSSGCIRVEHPFELAELLMDKDPVWNRAALDAAVAGGTTMSIPLPRTIPILLMYWTVEVHAGGRISYKPDVYSLDHPTLLALDSRPGD